MHPRIERARFGFIQVNGEKYTHDIVIVPGVGVQRRAKELSKDLYGTSHKFSLAEAEHVYVVGITRLIIGTGMFGRVRLMPDAQEFFDLRVRWRGRTHRSAPYANNYSGWNTNRVPDPCRNP